MPPHVVDVYMTAAWMWFVAVAAAAVVTVSSKDFADQQNATLYCELCIENHSKH